MFFRDYQIIVIMRTYLKCMYIRTFKYLLYGYIPTWWYNSRSYYAGGLITRTNGSFVDLVIISIISRVELLLYVVEIVFTCKKESNRRLEGDH